MKRLVLVLAIAALATAGCGGSSSSSSSSTSSTSSGGTAAPAGGGGNNLTLKTDPSQLKFDTTQLSAKSGKVTITMTNTSPLQHDIAIKGGVNVKGSIVGQGKTSTVSADLKPGNYTFYCSVDGHESAGMTGELVVK
ncbi:MAG: plastocyanin/azurin family copper-binding protein [Thermoleophilaceae bacterium]